MYLAMCIFTCKINHPDFLYFKIIYIKHLDNLFVEGGENLFFAQSYSIVYSVFSKYGIYNNF